MYHETPTLQIYSYLLCGLAFGKNQAPAATSLHRPFTVAAGTGFTLEKKHNFLVDYTLRIAKPLSTSKQLAAIYTTSAALRFLGS